MVIIHILIYLPLANEFATPLPPRRKQKDKEDLEEIVNELELVDEDEKVPFVLPLFPFPFPSPFSSPPFPPYDPQLTPPLRSANLVTK